MSMTNFIYDENLYPSFLFSYEEYSLVNSHTKLPIKCSSCNKTFYREKKQITSDIKKGKKSFYCCHTCASEGRKQHEEHLHTCKTCGKIFTTLPSKYASGNFCSKECSTRYSSSFSNTLEKRKQKSITLLNKHKFDKETNEQITNNHINNRKYAVIRICKKVLGKQDSITIDDYNHVRDIFIKHLYEENRSPKEINSLYNMSYKDFGNVLKTSFNIKLKSLSEASISYHQRQGHYDNKTEKELYYINSKFHLTKKDLEKIEGVELLKQYGMYNSITNVNGVSRDHIISISYGWENKIPTEIISHPANCRFITQSENSSKGKKCSITLEELLERIKNW